MKYEIGDRIILLNTKEKGVIIDVEEDGMILIEVGGVRFPVHYDDIDFPYFYEFSQKPVPPPKKMVYIDQVRKEKSVSKERKGSGVCLSFLPVYDKDVFDEDVVEKLKVFLINQNETAYTFRYEVEMKGETHFQLNNQLEALSEFYLHDIKFEDLNDNPRFSMEFSELKQRKGKVAFLETFVKLRAKQLFKKIEETQEKNEATFAYFLFEDFPDEPIKFSEPDLSRLNQSGFRVIQTGKGKDHLPPAKQSVDLHIHHLTDQPEKMNAAEMLNLQMETFERYFELAVLHRLERFTIIHGVGEGKLRQRIHEALKRRPEVARFGIEMNPGATEVYFR